MALQDTATTDDKGKKEKEKEVLVIRDQGEFVHFTGDIYLGQFEAKKKERTFKMHGTGIYKTNEGDIYSAVWDSDKISPVENVSISYHDGSFYYGPIKDFRYYGQAEYTYPDESFLSCTFEDNCPVGTILLTDPNQHLWRGQADTGFAWLSPLNHFYQVLESTKPVKPKKRRVTVFNEDVAPAIEGYTK